MKVLVTGGAGFIGSHLLERLLDRGDEVCVLDNLATGAYQNIARFQGHPRLRLLVTDITDERTVEREVSWADEVYHLAAAVGVRLIVDEPVKTIETNILGSHVVLSLCAKYHRHVLLASTSEVYGKTDAVPFREEAASVIGPTDKSRWAYACSKMMDEFLALAYQHERGLPVVIVRLFNTVGPRQRGRYGMVLPRFVQQALAGEPLLVHGTGEQTRCFGYVGDVVDGMLKLMAEPAAIGEVVNLGNDQEVSIAQLARRVCELTGSSSELRRIPYEEAFAVGFEDMLRRVPCLDKARRLVGYQPQVDLDGIISRVIEYYRGHPEAPR
ncbi:MAG: GDP-mannose 4,6-dehydratase [Fimbriimonadaceae bacterium]|nr:GDP-mannose 4,6-dehydratase [Fimbriimonadaceae bacterium]